MSGGEWPVLDSDVVWENPYFDAGYDDIERPDGETGRYYWIEPPDAVSVVAVDEDEVVLVEQPFPRHRQTVANCPGGGVDDDESFVEAGVRELREETGYVAGEAELLGVTRPIGWTRMRLGLVYATDLESGEHDRDAGEFLSVETVPTDEAVSRVQESSPAHGPAVMALLMASEAGLL